MECVDRNIAEDKSYDATTSELVTGREHLFQRALHLAGGRREEEEEAGRSRREQGGGGGGREEQERAGRRRRRQGGAGERREEEEQSGRSELVCPPLKPMRVLIASVKE